MAPKDHSGLSLRWMFMPTMESADHSVRWYWQAFTQTGSLFANSDHSFETLTECMDDAKQHGYLRTG